MKKNTSYSMRAFARDIGMSQTLLSLVLSGKRPLTLKQAHKVSVLLQLDPLTEEKFLDSTLFALPENAQLTKKIKSAKIARDSSFLIKNLDIEKFNMIANWYHIAILDLTTTEDFKNDSTWIASRLGIKKLEVEAAVERLRLLGLLQIKNGKLVKTDLHLQLPTQESKLAVRAHHDQLIEKARDQLRTTDQIAFSKRTITGLTLAIDSSKLDDAKDFIEEFKKEFIRRFTVGQINEVYQMNVQLFPLTTEVTSTKVAKGSKK